MKKATQMFLKYVRVMKIDFLAFPIEDYMNGLQIAIIAPDSMAAAIERGSNILGRDKGEMYARMKRRYRADKICPELHPVAIIKTGLKSVKDIPKHHNMQARGFELVVTQALNGIHRGDEIAKCDVTAPLFGNVECKFGRSKLYFTSEAGLK